MKRLLPAYILVSAVATSACDPFVTQESAAAYADTHELDAEMLGELLGAAPQFTLTPDAMRTLANLWIDFTLLGKASFDDLASLSDSQTVAAATWHVVAQRRVQQMYDEMVEARGGLIDSAGIDSAYSAGDVRYLQHILVSATSDLAPEVLAASRNRMEQVERTVRAGADFGDIAGQFSDDSTSAVVGGYLGVVTRGQTVPAFETVAWRLAAGATSGIVETEFGYHLIRRPPLVEVRDAFGASVHQLLREEMEALYADSLRRAREVSVRGSAPAVVRGTLGRFDGLASNGRTLASYPGGKFTVGDLVQWIRAFAPTAPQALRQASDQEITDFVEGLARNKVLLGEPDRREVQLPSDDWTVIKDSYSQQLAALQGILGIDPDSIAAEAPADVRERRVADGVMDYLRAVLTRAQPLSAPMVFLAAELRDRYDAGLKPAGIRRAFVRARAVRALDVQTIEGPPDAAAAPSDSSLAQDDTE